MQWPLTLTYIYKVFQPWLCDKTAIIWHIFSCPLYSMCSSYGLFSYLAQMITSFRGCVTCNDLWSWALSSRSFSHNFAIKLLRYGTSLMPTLQHVQFCIKCDHIWHKWSLPWECVLHAMTLDLDLYLQGYLAVMLPILCIILISGRSTTRERTMSHVQFPGQ